MELREVFEKAAEAHGHQCAGVAVGVRTALEAMKVLGTEKPDELGCAIGMPACWTDGVKFALGKESKVTYNLSGAPEFIYYNLTNGKNIRYGLLSMGGGMEKSAQIESVLTKEMDELFRIDTVDAPFPERSSYI